MAILKPGDEVRLKTRGRVVSVQGNRAVVQWSSGSISTPYVKSLEQVERVCPCASACEGEQRDPEAGD